MLACPVASVPRSRGPGAATKRDQHGSEAQDKANRVTRRIVMAEWLAPCTPSPSRALQPECLTTTTLKSTSMRQLITPAAPPGLPRPASPPAQRRHLPRLYLHISQVSDDCHLPQGVGAACNPSCFFPLCDAYTCHDCCMSSWLVWLCVNLLHCLYMCIYTMT